MTESGPDPVYTEAEVAERYHKKPETIRDWRKRRYGPKHFKAGDTAMYRGSALDAWDKEQERLAESA